MKITPVFSEALGTLDSTSLRFRPKNDEPVANGSALANAFERMSESDRVRSLQVISPALGMKLLALSGFMAEAAINHGDASWIRPALVLHTIEDFRKDYRENFRYLVLVAYASKQLGNNLHSEVESITGVASERARKFLTDFVVRDEELNRLEAFGMSAQVVDGVFRFVSA